MSFSEWIISRTGSTNHGIRILHQPHQLVAKLSIYWRAVPIIQNDIIEILKFVNTVEKKSQKMPQKRK